MALPPGKTHEQALALAKQRKAANWSRFAPFLTEDQRIGDLNDFCTRLHGGDAEAGRKLASDAIYEPSVAA